MSFDFETIFITGASSGIGEALAIRYAHMARTKNKNLTLILTGRNVARLERVKALCESENVTVLTKTINVTNKNAMTDYLTEIDRMYQIDLIIANAGISGGTGAESALEENGVAEEIFATNVQGVFNTIHPALAAMQNRQKGHIAIMSSLAGYQGFASAPSYCASKAAIRIYGEGLRVALAPYNVKVSVICPGFVKSRITDQNHFPMPFFMTAEKAARIITHGVHKNKSVIRFPQPMIVLSWLYRAIPDIMKRHINRKLPQKKLFKR